MEENKEENYMKPLGDMIIEDFKKGIVTTDKEGIIFFDSGLQKQMIGKLNYVNNDETESFVRGINWVDNPYCHNWINTKKKNYNLLKESKKLFFLAHDKDIIEGKPQLISDTKVRIPLIIKTERKDKEGDVSFLYKFIDDKYDKKFDGYEIDSLDSSFWSYRIIFNGEEYILFSKVKLGIEYSKFTGMEIKIGHLSEINKNLKMRGISKIFIVKDISSSINIYDKKKLIEFTKMLNEKIGLDCDKFIEFLFLHEDKKIYRHSKYYELLRVAQLLSGKYEGYPLHVINMGLPGKGKTVELEALDLKFKEEPSILEAGNSTTKALIPSFKEKPANPGYILKCRRVALIDELMKMVHKVMEYGRSDQRTQNHLQELNAILEHKVRGMGSGNDNYFITNPTAKVIFSTNPLPGKFNLYSHVGVIDESMLSRVLVFVHNEEERTFINENIPKAINVSFERFAQSVKKNWEHTTQHFINNINIYIFSVCVPSELIGLIPKIDDNIFMTIYDSCQSFLSEIDMERLNKMVKGYNTLMKEPLKDLYKKRFFHHSLLILDGLVKFRCLFKDFDDTFVAREEDYELLESIMIRIIKSWDETFNINY